MSKELIDVEMPDGTVIQDVPKGTTQSEITRRYQLQSIKDQQAKAFPTSAELGGTPGAVAPTPAYQGVVGRLAQLGHILADTSPGAATGNESTSIPGLDLLRGLFESGVPATGAGTAIKGAAKAADTSISEAFDPARLFNKVAGVPAGSKGVQVSKATGEIITNPGNAPIRALQAEGKSTLQTLKEALTARPTPELQVRVYGEMQNAGAALEAKLAPSTKVLTIDIPDVKKAAEALKDTGLDKFLISPNTAALSPLEAQQLRSAIGQRINWRETAAPTEANEALKDAWKAISDKLNEAVPGLGPYNKRWQEAYRYSTALAHRLETIGKGTAVPRSEIAQKLIKLGKVAATTGALGGTGYGLIRLTNQ